MILKCVLKYITNNCKPLQNFEKKLSCHLCSIGSQSFNAFDTVAWWENGTYCLSSVLFGHRNGSSEYFCKKTYQTWPKAVKTFKKYQNTPTKTHKNDQILLYRDSFTWIHIVLYPFLVPPISLKGGN